MEFFVLIRSSPHFGSWMGSRVWYNILGLKGRIISINIFHTMKINLNDPNTNWKFVGITVVVALVAAGLIISVV